MVWADTLLTPELSPQRLTPGIKNSRIRSLVGLSILVRTRSPFSTLPRLFNYPRLSLEIFRGEPAISEFV
jgi:hypothetical protein